MSRTSRNRPKCHALCGGLRLQMNLRSSRFPVDCHRRRLTRDKFCAVNLFQMFGFLCVLIVYFFCTDFFRYSVNHFIHLAENPATPEQWARWGNCLINYFRQETLPFDNFSADPEIEFEEDEKLMKGRRKEGEGKRGRRDGECFYAASLFYRTDSDYWLYGPMHGL